MIHDESSEGNWRRGLKSSAILYAARGPQRCNFTRPWYSLRSVTLGSKDNLESSLSVRFLLPFLLFLLSNEISNEISNVFPYTQNRQDNFQQKKDTSTTDFTFSWCPRVDAYPWIFNEGPWHWRNWFIEFGIFSMWNWSGPPGRHDAIISFSSASIEFISSHFIGSMAPAAPQAFIWLFYFSPTENPNPTNETRPHGIMERRWCVYFDCVHPITLENETRNQPAPGKAHATAVIIRWWARWPHRPPGQVRRARPVSRPVGTCRRVVWLCWRSKAWKRPRKGGRIPLAAAGSCSADGRRPGTCRSLSSVVKREEIPCLVSVGSTGRWRWRLFWFCLIPDSLDGSQKKGGGWKNGSDWPLDGSKKKQKNPKLFACATARWRSRHGAYRSVSWSGFSV